jgi:hypothetical protein
MTILLVVGFTMLVLYGAFSMGVYTVQSKYEPSFFVYYGNGANGWEQLEKRNPGISFVDIEVRQKPTEDELVEVMEKHQDRYTELLVRGEYYIGTYSLRKVIEMKEEATE